MSSLQWRLLEHLHAGVVQDVQCIAMRRQRAREVEHAGPRVSATAKETQPCTSVWRIHGDAVLASVNLNDKDVPVGGEVHVVRCAHTDAADEVTGECEQGHTAS